MSRFTNSTTLIDATTVDITTNPLFADVSMRVKLSLQLVASGITSGNGVFTVQVTNSQDASGNPTNWVTYNRLTTNVTNTNGQTDTRVASVTLSSNTSVFVFFPIGDYFRYIRVNVDTTTDGTYSAYLQTVD